MVYYWESSHLSISVRRNAHFISIIDRNVLLRKKKKKIIKNFFVMIIEAQRDTRLQGKN
jgi:hypothetical protein